MIKMVQDTTKLADQLIAESEDLILTELDGTMYHIPRNHDLKSEANISLTAIKLGNIEYEHVDNGYYQAIYTSYKIASFKVTPGEKRLLETYAIMVNSGIDLSSQYKALDNTTQDQFYLWTITMLEDAFDMVQNFKNRNNIRGYLPFTNEMLLNRLIPSIMENYIFTRYVIQFETTKLLSLMSELMRSFILKYDTLDGFGYTVGSYIALGILLSEFEPSLRETFLKEVEKIYTDDFKWIGDIGFNLSNAAETVGIDPWDFDCALIYLRCTKEMVLEHPFSLDQKNAGQQIIFSIDNVKREIQARLNNRQNNNVDDVSNFVKELLKSKKYDSLFLDGIIVFKETLQCWYVYFNYFNRLCDAGKVSKETERTVFTTFYETHNTLFFDEENDDNIKKVKSEVIISGHFSTIANINATSRFFEQHLMVMIKHIYQVPEMYLNSLYHFILREYIKPNELSSSKIRILF